MTPTDCFLIFGVSYSMGVLKMAAGLCGCLAMAGCVRGTNAPVPETAAPRSALVLSEAVNEIGALAREPMVVEHPNGALFVAGYGSPAPRLWRSADGGATWSTVGPLG
jgi:hypothetical protein